MNRNTMIGIGAVVVLAVVVAATNSLWLPLFVNDEVDEAFPSMSDDQRDAVRTMPQEQQDVLVEMAGEDQEMAEETALAMMEDDAEAADDMPADAPTALLSGTFNSYDPVHRGEGTATVYDVDGAFVLRLEDFRVTNGPQLHVLLAKSVPDNIRQRPDEGYIDLGPLKGNVGNQNYAIELPEGEDINDFTSVIIYCMPFHVNFSTAEFEA